MRSLLFLLTLPLAAEPLSLKEAMDLAERRHPALQAARATASAASEQTRQIQARFQPVVAAQAGITGVSDETARLFSAAPAASALLNHAGAGLWASQLLADFGRTRALTESARATASALDAAAQTTRAQLRLRAGQAFLAALRAQALLHVAQETVKARQLVVDQTSELARGHLKSQLDVTFARVNLEEARLLLSQLENQDAAARSDLAAALGDSSSTYDLAEPLLAAEPSALDPNLAAQALTLRPEARQAALQISAADATVRAEAALTRPSLHALAAAGASPLHPDQYANTWATAALQLDIPVFSGGLFAARRREAEQLALAARARQRDLALSLSREVQQASLDLRSAYEALHFSSSLLDASTQALQLAQARYDLGLASIVELSQAQLNLTRAALTRANATYDCHARRLTLDYALGQPQ